MNLQKADGDGVFYGARAGLLLVLVLLATATPANATRFCGDIVTDPCFGYYVSNVTFVAKLKAGTNTSITTSGGIVNPTITCSVSSWLIKTTNTGGGAGVNVNGQDAGHSWTSCTSANPAGCSSTASVSGLPTTWTSNWTSGKNGTLAETMPTVSFTCIILGTPVNCVFGGSGTAKATVTGGNPAQFDFTNQSIPATGGFGCPTGATWNATYELTTVSGSDTSLFLTNA